MLILSAITPVAFILYMIYKRDTEKEPFSLLAACLMLGFIITVPILIIEIFFSFIIDSSGAYGSTHSFLKAFLMAGFTEELFKFLALVLIMRLTKYFDQHYDGIVYAVFVSLGFAMIENIMYVMDHGYGIAAVRAILSVPAHAFFAVFMGYFLSLAFLGKPQDRKRNITLSLVVPVILHGLFDFFLFDIESNPVVYALLFFVLNIGLWRFGLTRIKSHIQKDKAEIAFRETYENDQS